MTASVRDHQLTAFRAVVYNSYDARCLPHRSSRISEYAKEKRTELICTQRTSGRSGSASEDDPAERGCSRSRTTLGSTPTTPGASHMTASLGGRYDPWPVKRSTDWLTDCKSEAEVTNNRRLRLTYCTIEPNHWLILIVLNFIIFKRLRLSQA